MINEITKIIDTASIRENDLIAFRLNGMERELTGIVEDIYYDGRYRVNSTVGRIFVKPCEVTDIC